MIDDTQNIYTLVEFIESNKNLNISKEDSLSTIYLLVKEIRRLNQIINDIYEFYKIDEWEWEGEL